MNERTFNIWREQKRLNETMNPAGVAQTEENETNYFLALLSEVNEHQECYIWKHWAKETKDGRRWEALDPQNAKVEAIDILFFFISLLQVNGTKEEDFFHVWDAAWADKDLAPAKNPVIEAANLLLERTHLGVYTLVKLLKFYFPTEADALSVYQKKLQVNYDRMKRGRKQVGDTLAEEENKSIH